jgi:hypothetical protein
MEPTFKVRYEKTKYKQEMFKVERGIIKLPISVRKEHIIYIHKLYDGNEYDILVINESDTYGEYITFKKMYGDLDGESVEVKYVIE